MQTDQITDDNVILKHHTDEEAVAELSHKNFPYKLRFFTNQSSVMVYLGNFFDESDGTRKNLHDRPGKKGVGYPKHGKFICKTYMSTCSDIGFLGGAFLEFHQPVGMLLYLEMRKHSSTDGILRQGQVMEAWHSTVVCPK